MIVVGLEFWFGESSRTEHTKKQNTLVAQGEVSAWGEKKNGVASTKAGVPTDPGIRSGNVNSASKPSPCSSLNPFNASRGVSCEGAAERKLAFMNPQLADAMEELPRITESILQGSSSDGRALQYLRQQCDDLFLHIEPGCIQVKELADQFRNVLTTNAAKGDANAQKLLALEMLREVQLERDAILLEGVAAATGIIDTSAQSLSSDLKWNRVLDYLRQASTKDQEAEWLLEELTFAESLAGQDGN